MGLHSALVGDNLHEAFHYVDSSDPGAVGADKYWLDTSAEPYILKRRNGTDDDWITIGGSGSGGLGLGWVDITNPTYGAVGDNSTNNTTAINAAIAALKAQGGGTFYWPMDAAGGLYRHTSALSALQTQADRVPIRVLFDPGVKVRPSADVTVFKTKQDDGAGFGDIISTVVYENVWVEPVTSGQAVAFDIDDSFGVQFKNCYVKNAKVGAYIQDEDSWSEGTHGDLITDGCLTGIHFATNGGTGSKQSTRLQAFIRTSDGGIGVQVDDNCTLYGSELSLQIWPVGDGSKAIVMNGDGNHAIIHGLVDMAGQTGLTGNLALEIGASATSLDLWQFDMEFAGDYDGGNEESGAVDNLGPVSWTHSTLPYSGGGGGGPADQLDANGTTLDVNTIVDGEYLLRSGTAIISGVPSGGGGGSATYIGVKVHQASPQTIGNSLSSPFVEGAFDAEDFDYGGWHDNVTNNTDLVVPTGEAGIYEIVASSFWGGGGTFNRDTRIMRNGVIFPEGFVRTGGDGQTHIAIVSALADGDVITVEYWNDSGSNKTVTTWVSVNKLGVP